MRRSVVAILVFGVGQFFLSSQLTAQDAGHQEQQEQAEVVQEGAAPSLQAHSHAPKVNVPKKERGFVAVTILFLVGLLALAYLGNHPKIRRMEQMLGISQVLTAGFPFVVIGAITQLPPLRIMSQPILEELTPLFHIGLGWLGILTGFQFDVRSLDALPKSTTRVLLFVTVLPVVMIALACVGVLLLLGEPWQNATLLRDAAVLGAAGALGAPTVTRMLTQRGLAEEAGRLVEEVHRLDDLVCIVGLAMLGAFFRPQGVSVAWQLPGTAWLFVTLGLGGTIGMLLYVVMRRPSTTHESMALLMGSVAFTAGIASYLALSPIVICFIAGVVLANLPGDYKPYIMRALRKLERPTYLLFLFVVGALWNLQDARGWWILPAFVVARLLGRWAGVSAAAKWADNAHVRDTKLGFIAAPLGALSIAMVVTVEFLYKGSSVQWMVTPLVMGAAVLESLVQFAIRKFSPQTALPKPLESTSL